MWPVRNQGTQQEVSGGRGIQAPWRLQPPSVLASALSSASGAWAPDAGARHDVGACTPGGGGGAGVRALLLPPCPFPAPDRVPPRPVRDPARMRAVGQPAVSRVVPGRPRRGQCLPTPGQVGRAKGILAQHPGSRPHSASARRGTASGAGRESCGHTALAPCQAQTCTVRPSVLDPRLEASPRQGPRLVSADCPFPVLTREGGGPRGSSGGVWHRVRPAGAPPPRGVSQSAWLRSPGAQLQGVLPGILKSPPPQGEPLWPRLT